MSFFSQSKVAQLYLGANQAGDRGYVAAVLPAAGPAGGFDIIDAVTSASLVASIVFLQQPVSSDAGVQQTFVTAVLAAAASANASRVIMWTPSAEGLSAQNPVAIYAGLRGQGNNVSTASQLNVVIAPGIELQMPNGVQLSPPPSADAPVPADDPSTTASFYNAVAALRFASPSPLTAMAQVNEAWLPFTGASRGCIQFDAYIPQPALNSMNWGFQFRYPLTGGGDAILSAPLAAPPATTSAPGFLASIDPLDPLNIGAPDRTAFTFLGSDYSGSPTVLVSYYRTTAGLPINLVPVSVTGATAGQLPARLIFSVALTEAFSNLQTHLAPEGDFLVSVAAGPPGADMRLLCGLHGTEYVSIDPSLASHANRLRFVSGQPAFAPLYPFMSTSPVDAPVDINAAALNPTFTTSWVNLMGPDTVAAKPTVTGHYVAQPKGAALYGRDSLINPTYKSLLGGVSPAVALSSSLTFPLIPYAGVVPSDGNPAFTAETIDDFERQVIGPTRRGLIGPPAHVPHPAAFQDSSRNVTTPAGLLVTLDTGGGWGRLLLGQNLPVGSTDPKDMRRMAFCQPDSVLQQAFQTGQLFLVVANNEHLGPASSALDCGSSQAFLNEMNVEDWFFTANVGAANHYDDYRNVMIVKGRKGVLYDPASPDDSLIASPQKWTVKDKLGAPADLVPNPKPPPDETVGKADPSELTALSYWLQRYFAAAAAQGQAESSGDPSQNGFFSKFNSIATNPNWTGILILRVDITGLPKDLSGITAGVTQPALFNAHHLAIEISQVHNGDDGIDLKGPSSIFGLIYYVDPSFTEPAAGQPPQPVPPPAGVEFDFRLLTLKVLFENTAVKRFQSYAQITVNQLFDMPVTSMGQGGNPFNTIVLIGSYQNNNGVPSYNLGSTSDNFFHFDNTFFNKIEIVSAQMSTLSVGSEKADAASLFALSGLLDFKVALDNTGLPFDVFSFGSSIDTPPNVDLPRKGLSFSGLGIKMSYPPQTPLQRGFVFDTESIRFDVTTSTPRPDSLFLNFALELNGLASGTKDAAPSQSGYLQVVTDARLTGVDGASWYGLDYTLNLGTPGALAGKVGLNASLLTAWRPDSTKGYQGSLGLKLPGTGGGAKLISLQNVLKLSIGQLYLTLDRKQNSFMLLLTEIAIQFLGLLKLPPNGSTRFYLFGNPKGDGKPSGLGWYAMYKTDSTKDKQTLVS
jgi:hypothetical protein